MSAIHPELLGFIKKLEDNGDKLIPFITQDSSTDFTFDVIIL